MSIQKGAKNDMKKLVKKNVPMTVEAMRLGKGCPCRVTCPIPNGFTSASKGVMNNALNGSNRWA